VIVALFVFARMSPVVGRAVKEADGVRMSTIIHRRVVSLSE
jgi:hypothetical protein